MTNDEMRWDESSLNFMETKIIFFLIFDLELFAFFSRILQNFTNGKGAILISEISRKGGKKRLKIVFFIKDDVLEYT